MILKRWTTASFSFSLLFLLISLISRSLAADPKKTITSFPNFPANIFFFDDSESAIYFDAIDGDVHVSQDEGKSWKLAEGIPNGEVRYTGRRCAPE
ncbi:hypothetical protein C8J56DRAFT_1058949 [Mycena floridula]|nr:hypothetical protein C8J56DRAFT_1058949 [Mycena floridula]